MGLIEQLGSAPVALDTAIFIYFIEANSCWAPVVRPLFLAADAGERELVTSAVTLAEVLVVPYRAGNKRLAESYEALLTGSRGIRLIDVTRGQLRRAAQLRAETGIRTPDALQLSAAREVGCTTFITNDRRLLEIPGLRIARSPGSPPPASMAASDAQTGQAMQGRGTEIWVLRDGRIALWDATRVAAEWPAADAGGVSWHQET